MKSSQTTIKSSILLFAVGMGLSTAQASVVIDTISWTGDNGYSMRGTMSYVDTYSSISAFEGTWDVNSAQSLVVSFYDPSSALLGTFQQVDNGSIAYEYLTFGYDTTTHTFDPIGYDFDMGWDRGDSGDYYLGFSGSYELNDVGSGYAHVDSGGNVTSSLAAVPEPTSTLALGGLLASGLFLRDRRSRNRTA